MAWIRLSDDYNDHPKFDNLSDGAFRLWHQAMGYCRKFKTDGLIPDASVRKFKAFSAKRKVELMTPCQTGENPLWWPVDGFGIKVHDYLEWNLSKEEEAKEADGAAKRMRRLRAGRRSVSCSPEQVGERSADVPGRVRVGKIVDLRSSEKERERKPNSESRWPIFKGNRLVVFDWMLTTLQRTLGPHADAMEWDTWLDAADQRALKEPTVAADWWPWLQEQLLDEARTRGWTVGAAVSDMSKTLADQQAAYEAKCRIESEAVLALVRRDEARAKS